ncbi:hypothetical protein ES703_73803 [subsurface metagenome]
MPPICDKKVAKTAVFGIPFSLELALTLSSLINCRQCGRCEREARRVFVAQEDVERIAGYINSTPEVVRGMMHIDKEELMHMPCPFYKNGCSIQSVKPIACKLYPLFQYPDGRLAVNLECQAGIDMHNLLSMERL